MRDSLDPAGTQTAGPARSQAVVSSWLLVCTRWDGEVLDSDVIAMTAKGQCLGRLRAAGSRPFRIGGAFGAAVLPVARHCSEVNVSGGLVGDCVEFTALMALAARVKLSLWTRTYTLDQINEGTGDFTAGQIQAAVRSPPTDGWGDVA